jgi:hypothetical protein
MDWLKGRASEIRRGLTGRRRGEKLKVHPREVKMGKKRKRLRHEQSGPFAELSALPNPDGLVVVHMPSLLSWLQRAEQQKRSALSPTEVQRICDGAPSIALWPDQVEAMKTDRDYADIDPGNAWEAWQESKRSD